jgi:hypothetical protein
MLAAWHLTSCSRVYSTRLVPLLQHHRSVAMSATVAAVAASDAPVQRSSAPKVAVGQMTAVGDQVTNFETCSKLAKVRMSASLTLQGKYFCTCNVFSPCCTRCTSGSCAIAGDFLRNDSRAECPSPLPLTNNTGVTAVLCAPGSTGGRGMYAIPARVLFVHWLISARGGSGWSSWTDLQATCTASTHAATMSGGCEAVSALHSAMKVSKAVSRASPMQCSVEAVSRVGSGGAVSQQWLDTSCYGPLQWTAHMLLMLCLQSLSKAEPLDGPAMARYRQLARCGSPILQTHD